jgi:hypothetical protein
LCFSGGRTRSPAEQTLFSRKAKLAETQREIQQEEKALQVIENDQARMRENMARVPQTSEAYKGKCSLFAEPAALR